MGIKTGKAFGVEWTAYEREHGYTVLFENGVLCDINKSVNYDTYVYSNGMRCDKIPDTFDFELLHVFYKSRAKCSNGGVVIVGFNPDNGLARCYPDRFEYQQGVISEVSLDLLLRGDFTILYNRYVVGVEETDELYYLFGGTEVTTVPASDREDCLVMLAQKQEFTTIHGNTVESCEVTDGWVDVCCGGDIIKTVDIVSWVTAGSLGDMCISENDEDW